MKIRFTILTTVLFVLITTLLIAGFLFLYSDKSPMHKKESKAIYDVRTGGI